MSTSNTDEEEDNKDARGKEISRLYGRLVASNVAFCLFASSFMGLAIIQSSVNGEVGVLGLGLIFLTTVPACLLLSPIINRLLGRRNALIVCLSCILMWMASNFYPHIGLVVPTSLLAGLANGPLSTAQSSYYTLQALRLAQLKGTPQGPTVAFVFGVFFFFLSSGFSIGCMVTSLVLQTGGAQNDTGPMPLRPLEECGANFCPSSSAPEVYTVMEPEPLFEYVQPHQMYILTSVHMSTTVAAILIVAIFVESLPKQPVISEPSATRWREVYELAKSSIRDTFRQLRRHRQILMMPITFYLGISKSFMLADITEAYITCSLGVNLVGYASITYGLCACLAALTCGYLVRKVGRIPIFLTAYLVGMGNIVFLLLWTPDPEYWGLFYLIPALWAVPDAILASQISAFCGLIFSDNTQGAFCTLKFLEGLGLVVGYLSNLILCVKHKLYVMLALFSLGFALCLATEHVQRWKDTSTASSSKSEEDTVDGSASMSTSAWLSADFSASELTWREFMNSQNEAQPHRRVHFETSV